MSFCTAINCMDGRTQIPVTRYMQKRFGAEYVDIVSEPGPNRILAADEDATTIDSIKRRVQLSVERHESLGIAVIGHHDCAGNPSPAVQQTRDTLAAVRRIRKAFPQVPVIGLWVNESWEVEELGPQGLLFEAAIFLLDLKDRRELDHVILVSTLVLRHVTDDTPRKVVERPSSLHDGYASAGHETCPGTEGEPLVRLVKNIEVTSEDVLF